MRQLEDYRYLREPENRRGLWWEGLKYLPLGSSREPPFLTLGGEVRVRYELIDNTDFGSGPQDNGGYLLTRYMPYASLTVPDLPGGAELQVFGQVEAAFNNYDDRGPGPIDEDAFDFLQAFAKISLPIGAGKFVLQGGRQHISFGSERLLGTRYGPNIPLSFDGGLLRWKTPRWDLHAFYLRPVEIDPDPLNNLSDSDQQLWGVYATRKLEDLLPSLPNAAVDFYYLGYFDSAATYNPGTGRELRHTVGSRLFGSQKVIGGVLDWNYEAMLQFGSFDTQRGEGSILAWSVGTETGYTLDAIFNPRFSLRANIISGDQNSTDTSLQTFSPLFPKGKYFGELTPVGPYNLINLLGAVGFTLSDKVAVSIQGGPYWRYSANDAVYGVGGNIVRASDTGPGDSSNARFIGMQLEFVAEWRPLRELAFLASYSQFQPGAFIAATGPSETIHFLAVEAVFQF
ncbi:MAG TPA: alginate export family protein [Terrimicrobiaceae bacterium]